jgi:hypothetical protein
VIGPLASPGEGANRRDAPPDDLEVEGGDRHRAGHAPPRLGALRERRRHDGSPEQRQPEVDGDGGGEQDGRAALARQDDGAGGAAAVEHVLAVQDGPRRRRDRRARRAREPGGEDVARAPAGRARVRGSLLGLVIAGAVNLAFGGVVVALKALVH